MIPMIIDYKLKLKSSIIHCGAKTVNDISNPKMPLVTIYTPVKNSADTLMKTIRDHNTSLDIFDESQRALNSLRIVMESMVDDYNISGAFDFDVLETYLSKVLNFKLLKIQAQHQYLLSLSKLNRLLLKGDAYQDLERYLPSKKDHKFRFLDHRKWENRKI